MPKQTNIAIFVSGDGTNCENIIRYFAQDEHIKVALVVSSRRDAYALVRAQRLGVDTMVVDKSLLADEGYMHQVFDRYGIDYIILAGFLMMIPHHIIARYPKQIMNIHPSLLPKYGGRGMYGHHVHEAVCANGETETGITIHLVSEVCDGGEILFQSKVAVDPNDNPDSVEAKVHALEHLHFPSQIKEYILKSQNKAL